MERRNTNGSTASLTAWIAPPLAVVIISSCARTERVTMPASLSLRRAFRLEVRMNDGAVAGERGRLDDVVVPVDRERLRLLVDQEFEERVEVLGVKARGGGGQAARHVAVTDDPHAADVGHRVRLDAFHIAAALDRKIDDHRARPHR